MKKCKAEGCDNQKPKRGSWCNICRNSRQRYGITGPERENILLEQKGLCKICNSNIKFDGTRSQYSACVDHCHETLNIRGILCGNCNTWLGYLENKKIDLNVVKNYLNDVLLK
jgi:hypothetical protein